ncbi:MAG: hypothetical protein KC643_15065 [Nitrospira sp.]|nr:hypothetical protein [Nitrospira sp.]
MDDDTPRIPETLQDQYNVWLRLEPRSRTEDPARGLEAQIADPLWLLTRQWQLGEFQAENGGSPVRSCVSYFSQEVNALRARSAKAPAMSIEGVPLEAMVEAEPSEPSIRDRIKTGQLFERLLRKTFTQTEFDTEVWPVIHFASLLRKPTSAEEKQLDRGSKTLWDRMEGQVLDGQRVTAGVMLSRFPKDLQEKIRQLYGTWLRLGGAGVLKPLVGSQSFWKADQLDYQFAIETKPSGKETSIALEAPSYRLGELDWYTFSRESLPPKTYSNPKETQEIFVPTKISVPGMPHSRWWDFEDSEVHFGQMEAGPADIGQLMFLQFGLVSSDDWFLVPLSVPVNSATVITKLEVWDVFGWKTTIKRAHTPGHTPLDRWSLFELDVKGDARQIGRMLLVPSAVPFKQESEPLEEVQFRRDEGANMVWAVEQRLLNQAGKSVDGFEAYLQGRYPASAGHGPPSPDQEESQRASATESEQEIPTFHLASRVPANWIPFLAQKVPGNDRAMQLRRAAMLRNQAGMDSTAIPSLSTILNRKNPNNSAEGAMDSVREEAIPRAGVKIQLTKQRVRWIDGSTIVWLGRKVVTGRGEASSGLKFDFLLEKLGTEKS